jgi:hypothetical protein
VGTILKANIGRNAKVERVRQEVPVNVAAWEVIDYRMCMQRASGLISQEEYSEYFHTVLPELKQMAQAQPPQPSTAAPPLTVTAPSSPPIAPTVTQKSEQGWVYLGRFNKTKRSWQERSLDFGVNAQPESLTGNDYKPVHALNVHIDKPNYPAGQIPRTIATLSTTSKIQVIQVQPWGELGLMWGQIGYIK